MAAEAKEMSIQELKDLLAQKEEIIAKQNQTIDSLRLSLSVAEQMYSGTFSGPNETDRLAAQFRKRHGSVSARSSGIY
ncbi:MAG TPA: hypothetical protein VLG69_01710 [Candidatus Andersenbacteria bacterium]|nr:hypothetical protein [Candidatus Andersenbacteria bacterium]